jgi:pyruvyl transferase EpsO
VDDGGIKRLREAILKAFRPLIDSARPVALVDFPDSKNSGDHAIWLGEKAYLKARNIEPAYQCSVQTYDKGQMAGALGDGLILMHGGGNFGDIYTLYHNFRMRVLADFPDNPVVVFPQTVMFFSDEAIRVTAERLAQHGKVTLAARDVLSQHILKRAFGDVAKVILAPDMAFMLGPLARSCAPKFDVVWISRTDTEGVHGNSLASAGLPPLQPVQAGLGDFDDGIAVATSAEMSGTRLLLSDWYRMELVGQHNLETYRRHDFDARAQFWFDRALRLMSAGRVVVTDRLHAHIICTLAGIPHVLLNNSYGKNVSFFESWSRPSSLCRLAATPAHAWKLAQQLLAEAPPAATSFRTDVARWSNERNLGDDIWKYRSERAARFVPAGSRLLDIGCGRMAIEQFLPRDCIYIPHDVVARDARTRVHDLNKNDRPDFEGATHISALGVLEYLNEPEAFWQWLGKARARVIFSYVTLNPSFPAQRRRALGWFNDLTRAEIVAMADRAGFDLVSEEPVPPDNELFVFDPRA